MKTKQWLSLTLAAALNLGGWLTTPSLAADTAPTAHGRFLQQLAQRLNLTADQKAQIKTILRAEKDARTTMLAQLHAARANLHAAIQAGDASETSVRAASAQVAAREADLAVERMKIYAKIAPILTHEQRQQISEIQPRAAEVTDRAISRAAEAPVQ
ncbi:MAG: Spy/CpxP family protein refolding chaperone [Verrucomicrobiota bacterium]|jgi:Spy/CpxP family protein refolding chaperone